MYECHNNMHLQYTIRKHFSPWKKRLGHDIESDILAKSKVHLLMYYN